MSRAQETAHYLAWREAVADDMAKGREGVGVELLSPPHMGKVKRGPSAYNIYMKDTLASYKAAHPDLGHKEAFAKVATQWAAAPENPKNQ